MTKQQINDIIAQHITAELADKDNLQQRVGSAFANWFQSLLTPPQPAGQEQLPPPEEGGEGAPQDAAA